MSAVRRTPDGRTSTEVLGSEIRRLGRELAALKRSLAGKPLPDHGALDGLADDDHPQYLQKADASGAKVDAAETTTSTAYTSLVTAGPEVTVDVGPPGRVLVIAHAWIRNSVDGAGGLSSFVASGTNSLSASDGRAAIAYSAAAGAYQSAVYTDLLTGLAPGSTTFSMRYRATGNTATFANRRLVAIPL
jgi:hypothetical protein